MRQRRVAANRERRGSATGSRTGPSKSFGEERARLGTRHRGGSIRIGAMGRSGPAHLRLKLRRMTLREIGDHLEQELNCDIELGGT